MRRFFYLPNYSVDSDNSPVSFLHQALQNDAEILLTDDIFHHWCRVLRAKLADEAVLFDGHGGEYTVQLKQVNKKSATATISKYDAIDRTNFYHTHIALVMSRGDRMDYALQKATEMGVNSIQLLTSQHGEVSLKPNQVDKKMAHWQQVILSACEQCGLNRPPLLLTPVSMTDYLSGKCGEVSHTLRPLASLDYYQAIQKLHTIKINPLSSHTQRINSCAINTDTVAPLHLILAVPHTTDSALPISESRISTNPLCITDSIKRNFKNNASCPCFILLIGAEGGFSNAEISQALAKQFTPWQIGERILRTETAPVVALASLQTLADTAKIDDILFDV